MTTPDRKDSAWLDVPKGTRASQCGGPTCKAVVFWISHPSTGRAHPVDCDVDGGAEPTARDAGRGVSHFATCPDAALFRRRK